MHNQAQVVAIFALLRCPAGDKNGSLTRIYYSFIPMQPTKDQIHQVIILPFRSGCNACKWLSVPRNLRFLSSTRSSLSSIPLLPIPHRPSSCLQLQYLLSIWSKPHFITNPTFILGIRLGERPCTMLLQLDPCKSLKFWSKAAAGFRNRLSEDKHPSTRPAPSGKET